MWHQQRPSKDVSSYPTVSFTIMPLDDVPTGSA